MVDERVPVTGNVTGPTIGGAATIGSFVKHGA